MLCLFQISTTASAASQHESHALSTLRQRRLHDATAFSDAPQSGLQSSLLRIERKEKELLKGAVVLYCLLDAESWSVTMETWVLKLSQVGLPDQPILVQVSRKPGGQKLDLDLLATDGESAYRTKSKPSQRPHDELLLCDCIFYTSSPLLTWFSPREKARQTPR